MPLETEVLNNEEGDCNNSKGFRWKRKTLTRHDLVASNDRSSVRLAPKIPSYVIHDLDNDRIRFNVKRKYFSSLTYYKIMRVKRMCLKVSCPNKIPNFRGQSLFLDINRKVFWFLTFVAHHVFRNSQSFSRYSGTF